MSPVSQWGVAGFVLFWGVTLLAAGIFSFRIFELLRYLSLGKREGTFRHMIRRVAIVIGNLFGQWCNFKTISRKDLSSIGHALMVWGFLFFATYYLAFIIIGEGFGIAGRIEHNAFYAYYSWIMDVLAPLVIIAVGWGLIRRYIVRPKRLQGEQTFDAFLTVFTIFLIPIAHVLKIGTTIAVGNPPVGLGIALPPISAWIGHLYNGAAHLEAWYTFWFWTHWGIVLFIIGTIGYGRHLHMVVAPFNILLRSDSPKGALSPIDVKTAETFGVNKITDFTWKQLIDLYACISCGRCQDACPAHTSGKPLSPKDVIQNLKKNLLAVGPGLLKKKEEAGPIAGKIISEDAIWSCTTCHACMEVCPVANEQMNKIVDLRRNLVLEQSKAPETLWGALKSIEDRGYPWRGTPAARTDWASSLGVKQLFEDSQVDILYYVGCTAALDERCQKTAMAMAKILNAGGVKFGILGSEESCCGDPARRAGNEYLFQVQAEANIELFKQYGVRKIITACPHCFNTLRNEYPQFGGDFEVVHHTQYIAHLLSEGKLKLKPVTEGKSKATYHDPCYLGRYNGIYQEPRQILAAIPGLKLKEMDKIKSNSFCCGGGGASWMEEAGTKISHLRIEDAIKTKSEVLALSCPFCMIMFEDARKVKETTKDLRVRDIAELIAEKL